MSDRWLDIFDRIQSETSSRVAAVAAEQLDDPTPCGDWNIRALHNHLIEINLQYAAIAGGKEPVADGLDHVGSDHVLVYTAAAGAAREAFARPGMLEQTYDFPWGQEPGWTIVRHVCNELLIHTWDLSRATGQSTDLVPDYVPESLSSWRAWFDSMGDSGT